MNAQISDYLRQRAYSRTGILGGRNEGPVREVAGGNALTSYVLRVGPDGRILSKREVCGHRLTELAYAYDDAGRLARVLRGGLPAESYLYDQAGRRIADFTPSRGRYIAYSQPNWNLLRESSIDQEQFDSMKTPRSTALTISSKLDAPGSR